MTGNEDISGIKVYSDLEWHVQRFPTEIHEELRMAARRALSEYAPDQREGKDAFAKASDAIYAMGMPLDNAILDKIHSYPEAIWPALETAARNAIAYLPPEKWGTKDAIPTAVDEVEKKAGDIQANQ